MKLHIAESGRYGIAGSASQMPPQQLRPPLRIPCNKTGAMLLIQQLAVRGHEYWTRGIVHSEKLPQLVSTFDRKFHVLEPSKSRHSLRARAVPTGRLIVSQQVDTDWFLWWLMVGGKPDAVRAVAEAENEFLYPIHDRRAPLCWEAEYELRRGARGSMTWWLQRGAFNDLEGELRYLASAHGHSRERLDDLRRAVHRARNRPMFAGVRLQIGRALLKAKKRWDKTHAKEPWPAADGQLPIMGWGMRVYDNPPEVVSPE